MFLEYYIADYGLFIILSYDFSCFIFLIQLYCELGNEMTRFASEAS